ncbi:hypothetical protein CDAR_496761 [Caerostris darwini]|uniref:Uncharacterized protein n=1 Tax=Caerostris darwini TaxID=1538125 RepID=A0AAV4U587_9ARAC|nr:hypothetical protein CDAR_496761 [Caerostris darwini]
MPDTVIIHIILGYVADSGQPKISAWILHFMKVYDTLHYIVSLKFGRTPPGTVPGVYFLMFSGLRVRNQGQQVIENTGARLRRHMKHNMNMAPRYRVPICARKAINTINDHGG